jgi:hypothetical protein
MYHFRGFPKDLKIESRLSIILYFKERKRVEIFQIIAHEVKSRRGNSHVVLPSKTA